MTANMRRSTDQPDWRHWLTLAAEHRLAGEHEDAVTALRAARRSVLARSEPVGEANVLLMDGLLIQDAGDHTRQRSCSWPSAPRSTASAARPRQPCACTR